MGLFKLITVKTCNLYVRLEIIGIIKAIRRVIQASRRLIGLLGLSWLACRDVAASSAAIADSTCVIIGF